MAEQHQPTQPGPQAGPPPRPGRAPGEAEDAPPAPGGGDPMQELLGRLERASDAIGRLDQGRAAMIDRIVQRGRDPAERESAAFRHDVAYLVQDMEKTAIRQISVAAPLREELTRLAASAPGLENPRMLALMGSTAALADRGLVRDIRVAGREIGREAEQEAPDALSRIETLENRVRLARVPAAAPPAPAGQGAAPPGQGEGPRNGAAQAQAQTAPAAAPPAPAANPFLQGATASPAAPGIVLPGAALAAPLPPVAGQVLTARSPLDRITSALRPGPGAEAAPWTPPPSPMGSRLAAFEQRTREGHDEHLLQRAERTGRAALDALQSFAAGEGATVMTRIREAARHEPGGMGAVLSEMRPGGRYADLRSQFNTALADERGVTGAYDRAAKALAAYGEERPAISAVIARRPDAANLSAKFEQMDAKIGEAAGEVPSRRDGKAMLDGFAKAAAELAKRAMEAVKAAFSRAPGADAGARPSSPGPG